MISIREERAEDVVAIRMVNELAFGQPQEGRLVETLRSAGGVLLSRVAVQEHRVVGHVLYSPVAIASGGAEIVGAGLGPIAVLPEFQRQGIGTRLVEAGNSELRAAGMPFIIVLGHPAYYPRFGFMPASRLGIRCEWDVSAGALMVLVIDRVKMSGVSGMAKYRREFSGLA